MFECINKLLRKRKKEDRKVNTGDRHLYASDEDYYESKAEQVTYTLMEVDNEMARSNSTSSVGRSDSDSGSSNGGCD